MKFNDGLVELGLTSSVKTATDDVSSVPPSEHILSRIRAAPTLLRHIVYNPHFTRGRSNDRNEVLLNDLLFYIWVMYITVIKQPATDTYVAND